MSFRALILGWWLAIRVLLYLVGIMALVFLFLTRTQVGRDKLRNQLEREFASAYEGTLHIGQLKGNLLNDLFASDFRLDDPDGNTFLSADSVILKPDWRDLFRRNISVGSITLMNPEIRLVRSEEGTWNIENAFRKDVQDTVQLKEPWTFTSTDIRIIRGSIVTQNSGPIPTLVQNGYLLDYTNAQFQNLNAKAIVEWRPANKLIDILELEGYWSSIDLPVQNLQGQIVRNNDHLEINQLRFESDESEIQLSFSIDSLQSKQNSPLTSAQVDFELLPSRISQTDLVKIFPSSPLSDEILVSARVSGAVSDLAIEDFTLERGNSKLAGNARLQGLPSELDYHLHLINSSLSSEDFAALLPEIDIPDYRHLGIVKFDLESLGEVPIKNWDIDQLRAESRLSINSDAGTLRGSMSVLKAPNQTLHYQANLAAETLNLGQILRNRNLQSLLNGHLELEGSGIALDSLTGKAHLALGPSQFSGRYLDTLNVNLESSSHDIMGNAYARRHSGTAFTRFNVRLDREKPEWGFELQTANLDMGPLLLQRALTTSLNTKITFQGSGQNWDDLTGEAAISFDSSQVFLGESYRLISPHRNLVTFASPGNSTPRLSLDGDIFSARIYTDSRYSTLISLVSLWGDAMGASVRRELAKSYRIDGTNSIVSIHSVKSGYPDVPASLDQLRLQRIARTALQREGTRSNIDVTADLAVKRSDLLTTLLPMLPPVATNMRAKVNFSAGPDDMKFGAQIQADSLYIGSLRVDTLQTTLTASANLDNPVEETLDLSLDTKFGTVWNNDLTLKAPILLFEFENRSASLHFSAHSNGRTGPFKAAAILDLLPDRNRLTINELEVDASGFSWTGAGDHVIDLYQDATVIHNISLENRSVRRTMPQSLHVHGVFSAATQDTVFVEAEGIVLGELSELASLARPVGGLLNGRIALTGGLYRPELTGALLVDTLTFDNRLLGQLQLNSVYIPGASDIALDARISPLEINPDTTILTETASPLIPVENAITIAGTFRLPRFDERHNRIEQSVLDLNIHADRADLFFFEYIFKEKIDAVTGYLTGSGTIQGSFTTPVFSAEFNFVDGAFTVPRFGLAYQVEGTALIDQEGIKLDRARVTDSSGGSALVTGGFLFNNYEFFSFDMHAELDKVQIINIENSRDLAFYGDIRATGTVRLTGPLYGATLHSANIATTPESEIFIPLTESEITIDPGYIIFADSTGKIPDLEKLVRRESVLATRPAGEREFVEGLEMDLNIFAPPGSTVHLVIDPLLGDEMNAVGTGRIQLVRSEGEFYTFGLLNVSAGDYLFSAGDVFFRRFLIDNGSISWDGDPTDAQLDVWGSYRTRASRAGLPGESNASSGLIPLVVRLHITGRVSSPVVDLSLAIDRRNREYVGSYNYQGVEAILNEPERSTEYATSVLLTNTFLLTASSIGAPAETGGTRNQFAFNSVSQLVASQINRYLNEALPNVDLNFGVQGERAQDLDVTYGVALRLLDERIIIRGQGVYENEQEERNRGEFIVEVKLSPAVSVEVFYRREGDIISDAALTNTTGAGLSYQTEFTTWRRLFRKIILGPAVDDPKTDTEAIQSDENS